ncbi:unnamed protein product [Diamesa tonsa]
MPPSTLDAVYRSLLLSKFFTRGWGSVKNLERLFEFRKIISNRASAYNLIPYDYPVEIIKEETTSEYRLIEGKFLSPLELFLPGLVPEVAQDAHFQMMLPLEWREENYKPVCLHLAGTGDHYFWRRRNLIVKPLMKESNLGAIILENPFYGLRKPKDQRASSLHNVSDILVMGGCLMLESLVLFNWCERNGLGPLGITGLSMGGHMASLAATNYPKPLVLVPCLSWSTASSVFTEGVMKQSINWDVLETQYHADGNYRERLSKMVTIVDDSFIAGENFIQNFNQSMKELKKDIKVMDNLTTEIPVVKDTPTISSKKQIILMNGTSNKLNLSEELLKKLLSTEKCELTACEINELNEKFKIAIKMMKEEHEVNNKKEALLKDNAKVINCDSTKAIDELQSDTSSNDTTTIIASALNISRTKLMSLLTPNAKKTKEPIVEKREKVDIRKSKWWERETSQFMRGLMDETTHLRNFSKPVDTSLIIAICAKDDAYVPRENCTSLEELWPGAEVRYLDAGHVTAYVLHQKLFRSSISEAFERSKKKWLAEKNLLSENEATVDFIGANEHNDSTLSNNKLKTSSMK